MPRDHTVSPEITWDLLSLVMENPPPLAVIQRWTNHELNEVDMWAAAVHLEASDNDNVIIPPRPSIIDDHSIEEALVALWRDDDWMFCYPVGAGTKTDARYLSTIFTMEVADDLSKRGYDLDSVKFVIKKFTIS